MDTLALVVGLVALAALVWWWVKGLVRLAALVAALAWFLYLR